MRSLILLATICLLLTIGCGQETTVLKGEKGDKGEQGQSTKGDTGDTGAQGPQGIPGTPGAAGLDSPGCSVIAVMVGSPGAPNGGALVTCTTGSVLVLNGTNGTNGANGTNGTNGVDSHPITFIKLCDAPVTFPTSLPEYGLCGTEDNTLYGVYWMSGMAWLGAIPNGTYNSTSATTSCSFAVSGCTVTH